MLHGITRSKGRHTQSRDVAAKELLDDAHQKAFQHICSYVDENIIKGGNVERVTMLRERYLQYMQGNYLVFYNPQYKTYQLKDK